MCLYVTVPGQWLDSAPNILLSLRHPIKVRGLLYCSVNQGPPYLSLNAIGYINLHNQAIN